MTVKTILDSMPPMEGSCLYFGSDFDLACQRAKSGKGRVWEHENRSEWLAVTPEQERRTWYLDSDFRLMG